MSLAPLTNTVPLLSPPFLLNCLYYITFFFKMQYIFSFYFTKLNLEVIL